MDLKNHSLWTERYRPTSLENYIGNESFRNDLKLWIEEGNIPNIILDGPKGIGKTTAAKLIVGNIDCDYIYINASDENGIDTIREKVKSFASSASFKDIKIIILDEADFLTPAAQAALRNVIETFSESTRFIFTCNYYEKILDPIRSRLERYELIPPTRTEIAEKCRDILVEEDIKFTLVDIAKLVKLTYPDNRQTLIKLQSFCKTGELKVTEIVSDVTRISDELINYLKTKQINKIRKLVIDLQLKDYTELYTILSDNLESYSDNPIISWYISESMFHANSSPNKQITFLGLIGRIINE